MNYIKKEKERIIKELLDSNKLKPGQLIEYKYFLLLYEPYKDKLTEQQFAEILGITYGSYLSIKNGGKRASVLKERVLNEIDEIDEVEKEEIINEILSSNKVKPAQLIDYKCFLFLYEPYKDKLTEQQFAEVLGIAYGSYKSIKNAGQRTRILRKRVTESKSEEKEEIIEEILDSNKVRPGQSINYEYFLVLYEQYKDKMTEQQFAEILGINYASYMQIKSKTTRKARVLKDRQKELSIEEKETIIEYLLSSKKIKLGEIVDYERFLELYELYKNKMSEKEFAKVLELTEASYYTLKDGGKGAKTLKYKEKKTAEEEKEKIIEELLNKNKIKAGQTIDYVYFLELYEPYENKVSKIEFARILGITYGNYMNLKNKGTRAIVKDYREKEIIDRISYILRNEARYYSKEEIEEICEEYGVNKETIIQYIFCAGNQNKNISDYINLLKQKGQIWIGQIKCSKKFANIHSVTIIQEAEKISRINCIKYGNRESQQDLASDCIEYILKKCGDIDKNFSDNEDISKKLIKARMNAFIKNKCLTDLKKAKEYSIYRRFTYKGDKKEINILDIAIEDKTQNLQEKVEENILKELKEKAKVNPEEVYIELLKINIEAGLNTEEAIAEVAKVLGINPKEMLEILKRYMIKQKRVRETKDGEYVLGEK